MARIIAPNREYSGISAGVQFSKGVGETSSPQLIDWFKSKGYVVELDAAELELLIPEEDLDPEVPEEDIDPEKTSGKKGALKKT